MALIDNTYFNGEIVLPQVGNSYQVGEVNAAIERFEKKILIKLLGYELYSLLMSAWEAYPVTPLPDRFDSLINGSSLSFTLNNHTITTYWNGLINDDKTSLISYYVHSQYLNETATRTNTIGTTKPKLENANNVDQINKVIASHNKCVDLFGKSPRKRELFNKYGIVDYSDFWLDSSNYLHWNKESSAYNFLLANKTTYHEWVFEPISKVNIMRF